MLNRGLAVLLVSVMLAHHSPGWAETAPKDIDLELFESSEVDRSTGCSIVLWQHDRDPDADKFAYLFVESLVGQDNARRPARIRIGGVDKTLKRVAKGGRTTGYDLFEFQLYQLPAANEFVILELELADEQGETVDVEAGKMTVVMDGKLPFRTAVKGNAGCMTPAVPDRGRTSGPPRRSDPTASGPAARPQSSEVGPGMFERYAVRQAQVPAKMTDASRKQFGCEPATMKKGVTAFQLSEEAAIWQIPCGDYGAKFSVVYALVYIPDPSANYNFLPLAPPEGTTRGLGAHALMDPTWDMKNRTVTGIHTEGNGSDCGQYERYQVTDAGGLRLVEFREKPECDGQSLKPQDFPLVFKAE
jgi:hypothetical protein